MKTNKNLCLMYVKKAIYLPGGGKVASEYDVGREILTGVMDTLLV